MNAWQYARNGKLGIAACSPPGLEVSFKTEANPTHRNTAQERWTKNSTRLSVLRREKGRDL